MTIIRQVDFHHGGCDWAISRLKKKLDENDGRHCCGSDEICLIVGKRLHSRNQEPVIGPVMESWQRQNGYSIAIILVILLCQRNRNCEKYLAVDRYTATSVV